MKPDTTARAAGLMAAGASTILNRTNRLVNGYGTPSIREPASQMFQHGYFYTNGDDNDIEVDPVSVESYLRSSYTDPRSGWGTKDIAAFTDAQSEHLKERESKLNNGEQVIPAAFSKSSPMVKRGWSQYV